MNEECGMAVSKWNILFFFPTAFDGMILSMFFDDCVEMITGSTSHLVGPYRRQSSSNQSLYKKNSSFSPYSS